MPLRHCPKCDSEHYRSDTTPWKCEECGMVLTDKHNVNERGKKDADHGLCRNGEGF